MKKLWIILSALSMSVALHAEQADMIGSVDGIRYQDRSIVVDDGFAKLALGVKVFDVNGEPTTIFAIKEGSLVRGVLGDRVGRQPIIVEIRLLSELPPSDDDLEDQRREE
ncbi:hypothetical protein QSV34_07800 [Porticoccus sp. W117]|uniref:hypothetical protein n=1 Tax=Porticoccus sp. W117 TaxID=3054777 RepID=UPI002596F909|nr:hypothetical protein [Porticoccus sp. W117]MDM3871257.1 hypothetical protein [Porticoccus sp. W117]